MEKSEQERASTICVITEKTERGHRVFSTHFKDSGFGNRRYDIEIMRCDRLAVWKLPNLGLCQVDSGMSASNIESFLTPLPPLSASHVRVVSLCLCSKRSDASDSVLSHG